MKFKDEKTLVRREILIPGGASFYVGATGLGIVRSIAESILILVAVGFVVGAFVEPAGSQDAGPGFIGAIFILAILALHKGMAVLTSRQQVRDFLPVN